MTSINLQSRLPKTYRIKSVKKETPMVQTFTFEGSLGAKPGQFLMVWLPGVNEVPMSVADDDDAVTKITFFAVGGMTIELAKCKVGDLIGLRGPFGTHYEWKPGEHIALVAGGYGAAPLHFLAQAVEEGGCTVEVIVGARSKDYLLYLDELKALPHVTLHVTTDDGSAGFKGYNVHYLEQMITGQRPTEPINRVFGCGPERMLLALSDLCLKHKIPAQLSLERYMKCGFGLCGNCVVDPLGIRLCIEGPVVHNDLARKINELGQYHRDALGKKHQF